MSHLEVTGATAGGTVGAVVGALGNGADPVRPGVHRGLKAAIRVHRLLAWFAGLGLVVWGISGLLHPLMTSFGPQQSVYRPPAQPMNLAGIVDPGTIVRRAGIEAAVSMQVVVAGTGLALQVTGTSLAPRRYFDVHSGDELPGFDARYAEFLARHYLGEQVASRATASITLQTGFDADYPQVNRLLPVWRIDFEGDDQLAAYVHTETSSLAAVNNRFKRVLQTGFQWFHTWDWLTALAGWFRVTLATLLVGSIFCLCLSGMVMLIRIHRRGRAPGLRGWHRIGAWAVAVPVFALSGSGLYHLWLTELDPPQSFLRHGAPILLDRLTLPVGAQWEEMTAGLSVNRLSIVRNARGEVLYRLGLNAEGEAPAGAGAIRTARFDGVPATGPALYIDARTGEPWRPGDREMALQLADALTGLPRASLLESSLVTRFGSDYDFRNKRVPVWRIVYGGPYHSTWFIDTATGVLVDAVERHERPERLSFAMLHKFNFLMMFGRDVQNTIVAAVVIAALGLLVLPGLRLRQRLNNRRSSPARS